MKEYTLNPGQPEHIDIHKRLPANAMLDVSVDTDDTKFSWSTYENFYTVYIPESFDSYPATVTVRKVEGETVTDVISQFIIKHPADSTPQPSAPSFELTPESGETYFSWVKEFNTGDTPLDGPVATDAYFNENEYFRSFTGNLFGTGNVTTARFNKTGLYSVRMQGRWTTTVSPTDAHLLASFGVGQGNNKEISLPASTDNPVEASLGVILVTRDSFVTFSAYPDNKFPVDGATFERYDAELWIKPLGIQP